jgi:hypothetical protein
MSCDRDKQLGAFVARLYVWLRCRSAIVSAIAQLRRAGTEDAVIALLLLPDVQAMRVGIEEWLEVVSSERAAALLLTSIPELALAELVYAFWAVELLDTGESRTIFYFPRDAAPKVRARATRRKYLSRSA